MDLYTWLFVLQLGTVHEKMTGLEKNGIETNRLWNYFLSSWQVLGFSSEQFSNQVLQGCRQSKTTVETREQRVEPVFALKFSQKIAILWYQIHIAAIIFVQGKLVFQAGYVQLNMREFRKGTITYLDSSDEQGKNTCKVNSNAGKLKPYGKISLQVLTSLCIAFVLEEQ